MTSPLELSARAALCRQLARREPDSRNLWLAEAERWSHLAPEPCAKSVAKAVGRHRQPAETWCWKVMPRCRPPNAEKVEVQFEFRNAAGADGLNELLAGISAEAGQPH